MEKNEKSRLVEMLDSAKGQLKAREKKVCSFLLENEDDLQKLSIAEIAEKSGVSKATVVRFCKSLGFSGLKEFKIQYEAGKSVLFAPMEPILPEDSDERKAEKLCLSLARSAGCVLSEDNLPFLRDFATDVVAADSIAICMEKDLASYAPVLGDAIHSVHPDKVVVYGTEVDWRKFPVAKLCLLVSPSGKDKDLMGYLSSVILAGGKVAVVTTDGTSLIARSATSCLVLPEEVVFRDDRNLSVKMSLPAIAFCLRVFLADR